MTKDELTDVAGPKGLWNINFIIVLVFGFVCGVASQMVNPLLAKYTVGLGASLPLAGTIVGLQSGISMFLRPVSGAASDLFNRKYVMVGSALLTGVSFAGYLLFSSMLAIIICRVLQGVSYAFMSVARTAYATEYMPKDRIGEGVAYTSFGHLLSQAVGPAVGLWVADQFGYNVCFTVAVAFSLLGCFLLGSRPYTHVGGKFNRNKVRLKNLIAVEIIPFALLAGLFTTTTQLASSFLALIGEERGIANVALFFTVYSVAALVVRPLTGRVLDKFGIDVLLYPSFVLAALTMAFIGMAQGIVLILFAGLFKALSQGVAVPSIQGTAIKKLGKERAGVASATIHLGSDLLNTVSPTIGAFVATGVGYANTFYIFGAIMLLGAPVYWLLRGKE